MERTFCRGREVGGQRGQDIHGCLIGALRIKFQDRLCPFKAAYRAGTRQVVNALFLICPTGDIFTRSRQHLGAGFCQHACPGRAADLVSDDPQRFLFPGDTGYFSVTTDGTLIADAVMTSRVQSPDGQYVALFDSMPYEWWNGEGNLWLQSGAGEPARILDEGGLALEWSPDSQSFFYDIGEKLY